MNERDPRDLNRILTGASRRHLSRRAALQTIGGTAALATLGIAPGAAARRAPTSQGGTPQATNLEDQLVFRSWGGALTDALQEAWVEPFQEQYGVEVVMDTGELPEVQLQQQAGNPQFDVVLINRQSIYEIFDPGLFTRVTDDNVANLVHVYDVLKNEDNLSVPAFVGEMGIVYNTDRIETAPTSWTDLWNEEYAGHVVTPTGVDGGWIFLLPIAKMLGVDWQQTMDPVWEKMRELQPLVLTQYASAGQMVNLLETEDGWIGPWYNGRAWNAIDQGLPLGYVTPEEGATVVLIDAVIPAEAKNPNAALAFANHILTQDAQSRLAELFYYGPTNRDVTLDPALAEKLPYGEEAITKLIVPDWQAITDLNAEWVEQWNMIFGEAPSA